MIKLAKTLDIPKKTAQKAWELLNLWYETEDFVVWEPPHTLALSALKNSIEGESEGLTRFIQKHSFKLIN